MAKYHLTDNGPKPCRAKTQDSCRYSGADHVEGAQNAIAAFEAKQGQDGKNLPASVSRSMRNRNAARSVKDKTVSGHPAAWSEPMVIAPNQGSESIKTLYDLATEEAPITQERRKTIELVETVIGGEVPGVIPDHLNARREFGGDNWTMISDFRVHQAMMENGYYGRITKVVAEDLKKNIGDGAVLDPMAGRGFAVKALREAGVPTVGTDNNSWNISSHLEQMDAMDSLEKYGNQVTHVLMSWPDYELDIDRRMLAKMRSDYPHLTMIYIGEEAGCTGTEEFWGEAEIIEPEHQVRYSTTHGIHDDVYFIK